MEIANFISDFENLPKQIQEQILDYIEFLTTKYKKKEEVKASFKFDWEGGLSEKKKDFTSVELQHQANELR
jgi:hypothetical protein